MKDEFYFNKFFAQQKNIYFSAYIICSLKLCFVFVVIVDIFPRVVSANSI